MNNFSKLSFSLSVSCAVVLLNPVLSNAGFIADFTNDEDVANGIPAMVDTFDLMVWNYHTFTLNPTGEVRFGDANQDMVVDVSDFNIWNSQKYNGFPNDPTCSGPCYSDAALRHTLDVHNELEFSTTGTAPEFDVTTVTDGQGTRQELRVTIPAGQDLIAFTVTGPTPTSIEPDFDPAEPVRIDGNGDIYILRGAHFDGRQQFATAGVGFDAHTQGWESLTNELVATYPAGTFPNDEAPVFFQAFDTDFFSESDPVMITATQNIAIVPEPSAFLCVGLVVLIALGRTRFLDGIG